MQYTVSNNWHYFLPKSFTWMYPQKGGTLSKLAGMLLSDNIQALTSDFDYFYFVTNNKPQLVSYQRYWIDTAGIENESLKNAAKINFNTKKWPTVNANNPVIDIRATNKGLYALTINSESKLFVVEWKRDSDALNENANHILIADVDLPVNGTNLENLRFLVASSNKRNYIFLYCTDTSEVYFGEILVGQTTVKCQHIDKLKGLSHDNEPELLLAIKDPSIKNKQEYLDILGMEKKTGTLFTYSFPIKQNLQSKLVRHGTIQATSGLDTRKATVVSPVNYCAYFDVERNEKRIIPLIFVATELPNKIFAVSTDNTDNIDNKNVHQMIKSDTVADSNAQINAIEVLFSNLLVFGNSITKEWTLYPLPYYEKGKRNDTPSQTRGSDDSI